MQCTGVTVAGYSGQGANYSYFPILSRVLRCLCSGLYHPDDGNIELRFEIINGDGGHCITGNDNTFNALLEQKASILECVFPHYFDGF